MSRSLNLVAFDCGNSSVRTLLCHFDGKKISSELILQEPNGMYEKDGYFYWDMENIFSIMKRGLGEAAKRVDRVDSAGVCTWGVDFQLYDKDGSILQPALSYRNTIGAEEIVEQSAEEQSEMFFRTGILCDKINSMYMMKGMRKRMPEVCEKTAKILMVPDIFVYMFTGVMENEPSEFSTTQLMDVQTMSVSEKQCEYAGFSPDVFSRIGVHGTKVGDIKREVLDELNIDYDIPFVCVPSHDTACAVMAVPARDTNYLFVSSGTWSLIGAQIDAPAVSEEVMKASLTNEVGAFGKITLLRNSAGMFMTQRLKSEYEEETGSKIGWGEFTAMADAEADKAVIFDVNDTAFFNPEKMITAIREKIGADASWSLVLASTYKSMGRSFADVSKEVMKATGQTYDKCHVVGGGSRNMMIMQEFADSIGLPILTCDQECSSVGNAVSQIAYFHPEFSYAQIREIISDSLDIKTVNPVK